MGDQTSSIPDRLPRLDWGSHKPDDGKLCAMEAAAWLAGESWTDHPRSVHRVVAFVARQVNDAVSDDVRQTLWPLIIDSLGTARPFNLVRGVRLRRRAARSLAQARVRDDLPQAWRDVLDEHSALYGISNRSITRQRLESLMAAATPNDIVDPPAGAAPGTDD